MENKAHTGKILLIDDEPNSLKVISAILRQNTYEVATAPTAEDGLKKFAHFQPDTVIADYKLPGMSGIDFLEIIKKQNSSVPVIMLTAYGTIEKAVDAMRKGAYSYLTKPVNPDQLLTMIRESVEKHCLIIENHTLRTQLKDRYSFRSIFGRSSAMNAVFSLIETVSKSSANVLIEGESGTGKELAARAIHYESPRSDKPFVTIDCTSLPAELLESELFGHKRGAFTGAYEKKTGQIERADGGTVFLDEIGELPLVTQKKFLRFLQEREFLRVGSTDRIKVDVRIIAATNRNLQNEVSQGTFREDLYFRLNVVRIRMPSLRERKEDIPLLSEHFLVRFNKANNKAISSIETRSMDALTEYSWPGNVRELENAVERAVVLCPGDTLSLAYFPRVIREMQMETVPSSGGLNLLETERKLLLSALEKTAWNQTRSAELLGITRKQLRTKMKNHGLMTTD